MDMGLAHDHQRLRVLLRSHFDRAVLPERSHLPSLWSGLVQVLPGLSGYKGHSGLRARGKGHQRCSPERGAVHSRPGCVSGLPGGDRTCGVLVCDHQKIAARSGRP